MDTLIVGAGFAGAVTARELADAGERVLVIDKRAHVAGNAYDRLDAQGVLIHEYGPHIFHTNSEKVFEYLSRFTAWRAYEHRVLAVPDARTGAAYPMPVNRTTINGLYGLDLDEAGIAWTASGETSGSTTSASKPRSAATALHHSSMSWSARENQ